MPRQIAVESSSRTKLVTLIMAHAPGMSERIGRSRVIGAVALS